MGYEKLTPKLFAEGLANGKYNTFVGANRAIGRMEISEAQKTKCRTMAEEKLSGKAPKAKAAKKTAKKAAKKTRKTKKFAKKAASKVGPGKGRKKKAAKKVAKKAAKPAKPAKAAKAAPKKVQDTSLDRIHLIGERVGTVTQALQTLERAKELAGVDITRPAERAVQVIDRSMEQLANQMDPTGAHAVPDNGAGSPAVARAFAETAPAAVPPPTTTRS